MDALAEARDGDLLTRFVAGEQESLAALVERHQRMVYRVCLRALDGDAALAQDAAQAVFIVLARKAESLASRPDLGGWLHTTARYAAANARRAETQRKQREAAVARDQSGKAAMPNHDGAWDAARPLLDAAMATLGNAQREALVLCLLEELPQGEAARRLGCSQQAVQQRIAAGIKRLRHFLNRRGVVIPATALSIGMLGEAAAAVPADLGCTAAAAHVASGLPISPTIHSLAQGITSMHFYARLKTVALAAVAVAVGLAGLAAFAAGGEAPPVAVAPPLVVPAPAPAPPGGAVVNGLRLVLRMKQTELTRGESWTGAVFVENADRIPVDVFPKAEFEVLLTRSDGRPVRQTMYMGSGTFDPAEMKKSVKRLALGEALEIFTFRGEAGPQSTLGGSGSGLTWIEYRLTPGEYRLKVRASQDGRWAKELGIVPPVWTGVVESNEAVVTVKGALVAVDAPIVQGLQVTLEGPPANAGLLLRNVSDKPVVVNLGGFPPYDATPKRLRVEVTNEQGVKQTGWLSPSSMPSARARPADYFVTIEPQDTYEVCRYWLVMGQMDDETGGRVELGSGTYTMQAIYENDQDGVAVGAPQPAVVGRVVGNRVTVVIP